MRKTLQICKFSSENRRNSTFIGVFQQTTTMKYIQSLLSADRDSLSSKRLCGIVGWLCCSAVLIMCAIKGTQAPEMVDILLYSSAALLGVDSITDIWKAGENTNKKRTSEDE